MALGAKIRRAAGRNETRGRMLDAESVTIAADGSTSYGTLTQDRLLTIPVVYSGTARIAEAFRVMPLELKMRAVFGGRSRWVATPPNLRLAELLCERPNPEMSSGEVFELLTGWKILRGNAYLYKERDRFDRVVNLWPLPPTRVSPRRDPDTLEKVFDVSQSSDDPVELPALATTSDLIHFRAFGTDPLRGLGAVEAQRLLTQRTREEEEHQNRQLRQMVRPAGFIEAPNGVSDVAQAKLVAGIRKGGIPVLPDGMKFHGVSLSAADAKFIEARQMTRQEWAMILRLPPSMLLTDTGGSMHYDSAAADGQFFVTHTLLPWIGRFQDALAIDPDLPWGTTGRSRGRLYPRFNPSAFMRADDLKRAQAAAIGVKNRWLDPEDQREAEGLAAREIEPEPTPEGTNAPNAAPDQGDADALAE